MSVTLDRYRVTIDNEDRLVCIGPLGPLYFIDRGPPQLSREQEMQAWPQVMRLQRGAISTAKGWKNLATALDREEVQEVALAIGILHDQIEGDDKMTAMTALLLAEAAIRALDKKRAA